MKNYVIYDSQGVIQAQGSAPENNIRFIRASLTDLYLLEVENKVENADFYLVVDGHLTEVSQATETSHDYRFIRNQAYGSIGYQLDLLYKDIQAGLFGEAAKGSQFANFISSIKTQYPKQ
jgi:hypothetical protein